MSFVLSVVIRYYVALSDGWNSVCRAVLKYCKELFKQGFSNGSIIKAHMDGFHIFFVWSLINRYNGHCKSLIAAVLGRNLVAHNIVSWGKSHFYLFSSHWSGREGVDFGVPAIWSILIEWKCK